MQVIQKIGQSVYDLTLQSYCTLDLIVKFCIDNNISDINNVTPQIPYTFDGNLVLDQSIKGYVYTTDVEGIGRIFSDEFSIEFS